MSPYNWAGTIWTAAAHGTFSVRYDDGTFAVTGTMDSALATEGTPGHMGHERNGVFAFEPPQEARAFRERREFDHLRSHLLLQTGGSRFIRNRVTVVR